MAWPFLTAVNPDKVPNYYKTVKEPMGMCNICFCVVFYLTTIIFNHVLWPLDLAKIEKRVASHEYAVIGDFIKDITKIFDNCRYYNPTDSAFYQCAEVLETLFIQKLKLLKEKLL